MEEFIGLENDSYNDSSSSINLRDAVSTLSEGSERRGGARRYPLANFDSSSEMNALPPPPCFSEGVGSSSCGSFKDWEINDDRPPVPWMPIPSTRRIPPIPYVRSFYARLPIIPQPLLQQILSYLQPSELGRFSTVSREMNQESDIVAEMCVKKILREMFMSDAETVLKRLTQSQERFSFKKFLLDVRKKRILVLNGHTAHSAMLDLKKNTWESKSVEMTHHRAAFSSVWFRGELVVLSGNVPGTD